MKTSLEDLEEMLHRDGGDKRFVYSEQMRKEESEEFIRTAKTMLEHELLVTAVDARVQADYYWEANESARESGNAAELSFLGTRVRFVRGTLQLEWFRNRTRPDEGKGKQVYSTYIKKGLGHRYSDSLYKKEPAWAREAIKTVEDRYELLRKRAAILSALKKNIRDYEQAVKECYQDEETKQPTASKRTDETQENEQ